MNDVGVIDRFLNIFSRYIDSGFGLLGGEIAFLATTLIVIDVTLAALFWAWGADNDILARLIKKTLFVGVFAYLIGNWNTLARIVFESFAGLGLQAAGGAITAADFLRPGRIAQTGLDAGRPILQSISGLMGYISFFENFIQIAVLLFAWMLVILSFFILAIQLFVTLIEFPSVSSARPRSSPSGSSATSFRPVSRSWCSPSSSASARHCFRNSPKASAPSSRP